MTIQPIAERLRTDAEYAAARVGTTIRQIGRDCAEAADHIESLERERATLRNAGVNLLDRAETAEARIADLEAALAGAVKALQPFREYVEVDAALAAAIRARGK